MADQTNGTNLFQRMLAISDEVKTVSKDTEVSFRSTSYKGVSHDAVVKAVRDVAIKHGVLITPTVTKWEDMGTRFNVEVTTIFTNVDDPEENIAVVTVGQGMDSQDKAAGKAISYAKKYGLLLAFQLETVDGDETRPNVEFKIDLDHLQMLLSKRKKSVKAMLDHLGIDTLEDITKEQYAEMVRTLS